MCNYSPIFSKALKRAAVRLGAASQQPADGQREEIAHHVATVRPTRLFRTIGLGSLLVLTAACKQPPDERQFTPIANAVKGKAAIERVGCGSCHTIPGLTWPRGKVGPQLDGLADRALIAGRLPNRPDLLAAYIRNAPEMVPGSGMPAMPVSEREARDIAAYLYDQGTR